MSSFISCPDCKRKLKVPETMLGKSFRCPACKTVIEAELEEEPPPPSRAVKTAQSGRSAAALPRIRPSPAEEPEDDFEPEEEEPIREKPRRKRRPIRKRSSSGLIIGLVAGGAVLFLLVLAAGGGLLWYFLRSKGIPDKEWQTFTPPGGDCTVLMPGAPLPQTLNLLGLKVTQYQLERKKEKEIFIVAVYDIPQHILRPNLLDDMANGSRAGALNSMGGGQVTSDTPITLGNIPGREYQIKPAANPGILIVRVYLAKVGNEHREFLLMVGGDFIQPNKGDAAHFLDSVKMNGSASAPELTGAAAGGGMQPPPMNPKPNPPQFNPGRRPRGPRRPL